MRGSPRSLWLSMANRLTNHAVGAWAGAVASAAKRNRSAVLKALTAPPKPKRTPRRKPR